MNSEPDLGGGCGSRRPRPLPLTFFMEMVDGPCLTEAVCLLVQKRSIFHHCPAPHTEILNPALIELLVNFVKSSLIFCRDECDPPSLNTAVVMDTEADNLTLGAEGKTNCFDILLLMTK